jgi:hypothetical protein
VSLDERVERELRIAAARGRFISVATDNGWTREDAEDFARCSRTLLEGADGFFEAWLRVDELSRKYEATPDA